jgi:hypothetical protein
MEFKLGQLVKIESIYSSTFFLESIGIILKRVKRGITFTNFHGAGYIVLIIKVIRERNYAEDKIQYFALKEVKKI